ncbi:MAG: fatty acid oxidation complex subunit alpha FadJ [Myxococcales bacterium]|nr:fatty acid oxidation complex subunit alpha FadJ [Myxococcales bacterium]
MTDAARASSSSPALGPVFSFSVLDTGVGVITYDVPGESMNTLRADFVADFERILAELDDHPDVRAAVLISGKADSFIAGADLKMLDSLKSADDASAMCRRGHELLARLAGSRKPVVAAIHGAALGGGLEIALACAGRVLSDSKKTVLGLPEVQLGLLPGLNGLQRLASLVGLQLALDHALTGKNIRAEKALKLGLADEVVPAAILQQIAARHALRLADERVHGAKKKPTKFGTDELLILALEKNPIGRSLLFKKARDTVRKKTLGHYPAPEKIIDVLEAFASRGLEASRDVEARAFGELCESAVSKNLRSIFFATTALKKDTGTDDAGSSALAVEKIGVLGAGLMGAGIAYVTLDKGILVRMKDRDSAAVGRGLNYVAEILDERVKKKQLDRRERTEKLARLSGTTDYSGMKTVELVIEAVFEDLDLKRRVLAEVESACKPGVIFASNTSSIAITKIAEGSRAPENVVGMHYFSPVHKMPLLEVIRTKTTTDKVVRTAVALGKRQGKTVIVVNDGVGFYTSRVLGPYMNEASFILTEGAAIDEIDQAMTRFGWPVGPLMLADEVGLDVAAHVGPIMVAAFGDRMAPPPTVGRLIEDGRKGRKNGRGFYLYGEPAKKLGKGKHVDETAYAALGLAVPKKGKSPVLSAEIEERCNLQFLNEALHCYGEGVLRSARDGDIGAVFGLGFPPFLGGPFRYVDALGAGHVLARMRHYQNRFGLRFAPAPALLEKASSGARFFD